MCDEMSKITGNHPQNLEYEPEKAEKRQEKYLVDNVLSL